MFEGVIAILRRGRDGLDIFSVFWSEIGGSFGATIRGCDDNSGAREEWDGYFNGCWSGTGGSFRKRVIVLKGFGGSNDLKMAEILERVSYNK